MKIVVKLDELMLKRKIRLNELAPRVDITEANLVDFKDRQRRVRFDFQRLRGRCSAASSSVSLVICWCLKSKNKKKAAHTSTVRAAFCLDSMGLVCTNHLFKVIKRFVQALPWKRIGFQW